MTTNQMAAELIKGPLYIVGEGGEHGGSGINFARRAGMLNYGGRDPSGDIVLALIPRTTRIENKDRMSAIHGQLLEMYGAFFSAITHFSGIEKTMPIDLDADNDPDWSHDNMANPFYRSNRSLTAHGYFVPYGKKSVGAHRGQIGGATLESHARAKGITIPQVDTADPEAIRDLAKILLTISEDLFSRNDNEFSWDSERGARVDAQADPLYGKQWWRATRMQIFGWMVQLEVLKSMEMAKLKAEGKVPWNERLANLVSAQEILSFWNDEVTMGMLFGVDVYQSGGDLPMTQNPVALFRPSVIGDHIMVLNRTALVMLHKPVTQAAEAEIYSLIRNPQIRKPDDPSKVWNPYYQRWIDDPDFGTTAQDET